MRLVVGRIIGRGTLTIIIITRRHSAERLFGQDKVMDRMDLIQPMIPTESRFKESSAVSDSTRLQASK